jgi:hypothetical protein
VQVRSVTQLLTPAESSASSSLSNVLTPSTPTTAFNAANFRFPIEKMPMSLKEALKNKTRPEPANRREMIRILADSIYSICKRPGRNALRQIVGKLVCCIYVGFTLVLSYIGFMKEVVCTGDFMS